jgi:hypothetical protein
LNAFASSKKPVLGITSIVGFRRVEHLEGEMAYLWLKEDCLHWLGRVRSCTKSVVNKM